MESGYTKLYVTAILSLTLIIAATSVHKYYSKDVVKQHTSDVDGLDDVNVLKYRPGLNGVVYNSDIRTVGSVEQFYANSGLASFASRHRQRLAAARNERSMMCGTLVKVSKLDCEACSLLITTAKSLLEKGGTQEDIVALARTACIDLEIEDERVCDAIVIEFKEELFGTLVGISMHPDELCGYVLGSDCGAPYNPEAMWNVTFPNTPKPPAVPPTPPKAGSPTMRVLHLTDFHFDPLYTEGSNADCGEPLCCRANDGQPKPGVSGAGKYGDYRNCDAAKITLDSLFTYLKSIEDQFDYVMFTGDIPPHNVWNQSRTDQLNALETFMNYILYYLPDKKVCTALGNHESAPVNSFPPPFIKGNNSEDWLYKALADSWKNWLPLETQPTILKGAYYSYSPFPGLRIISLNTNMCNNMNWWLLINATDPAGMLQWFIGELQAAEDKGEKVHILGHIYPGCSCCLKPWSWNYYKIVNRYENTIVEQFFGHTHSMTYEMFYDVETLTRPLGTLYMPGSITTYSDLNPGFRIYEIDGNYMGSTWRVQDYTNYYMNLTAANLFGNPTWEKEYSAKTEYGLSSLFPSDWNKLIYRMKDDDQLFQAFCNHVYKSAPNNCSTCTGDCKTSMLCDLKTGRNGDAEICKDLYSYSTQT